MNRSAPFWSRTGATSTTPAVVALPDGWRELKVHVDALSYVRTGRSYTAEAVGSSNGVTTLTLAGSPTGGSVTLIVFPADPDIRAVTASIPYNESAANIKTALVNTGLFASGDITAAGGALNSAPVTLTWTGVYATIVPPLILGTNSLTGGSNPSVIVTTTTVPDGNGGYGYVVADEQEVWQADPHGSPHGRYLYVAAVTGTGNYFVSAYR